MEIYFVAFLTYVLSKAIPVSMFSCLRMIAYRSSYQDTLHADADGP